MRHAQDSRFVFFGDWTSALMRRVSVAFAEAVRRRLAVLKPDVGVEIRIVQDLGCIGFGDERLAWTNAR